MKTKHFLTIRDLSKQEIWIIFERAKRLKSERKNGIIHPSLKGKTLAMIFEKHSTRTRVSFETAMFELGGQAILMTPQESMFGRGEPIQDTARVLSRYVHGIMMRTYSHTHLEEMAKWADVPVINGLTDLCHPCQVLADLFTIWEEKKELTNLKIAWIGDGFNMANSWLNAAIVMNLNLWMACPKGYEPNSKILSEAKKKAQVKFFHQPKEVIEKAEVINTDVWTSMGQEKEIEKRKRDFQGFTLDKELVSSASPSHIILHCLPAHRGEEITEEILEGPNSKIFEQAENRLHIQKALLEWLLS